MTGVGPTGTAVDLNIRVTDVDRKHKGDRLIITQALGRRMVAGSPPKEVSRFEIPWA